jgi:hypothetical protein
MNVERDLMQFCPRYDDEAKDAVMAAGWLGCVSWALGVPEIVSAFENETGKRFRPPATVLDRMIDTAACGVNTQDLAWDYLSAFAQWVTTNIWGDADASDDPTDITEGRG